jgi:hypothetical protein
VHEPPRCAHTHDIPVQRADLIGNITRHDATGADHRARSDPYAGQDDRASANPHVRSDVDRLSELRVAALPRVERVHRRVDLHGRSKQRVIADPHAAHVEDDAVEVEEDALA